MKKTTIAILVLTLAAYVFVPAFVFAQGTLDVKDCGTVGGIPMYSAFCSSAGPAGQQTATDLVLSVISMLLVVAAIIAILYLIIGGVRYITAAGNEELSESAKKTIQHAIIGLVIIILSFVIISVISEALVNSRV